MRRVVIHRAGGYDRLKIEEHPDPVPGAKQVRIRSAAIGVNYADCVVRMGLYASAKKYVGWPITPGFEVAGRVDAVGSAVCSSWLRRDVVGVTRFGGYADALTTDEGLVFPRPKHHDVFESAGFPTVSLTAWYALVELCRLRPGGRVLVHSAAGGVGIALVRIATKLGCRVTGVVGRAHKADVVRSAGADAVICKATEDWRAAARRSAAEGFDAVLDANGAETLRTSYDLLAPGGRLIVYGFHTMLPKFTAGELGQPRWVRLLSGYLRTPRFSPLGLTTDNRSVMGFNLSYLFDRRELFNEAMAQLLGWAEDGTLPPAKITRYPLDQVKDAHQLLESGESVGKIVLVP